MTTHPTVRHIVAVCVSVTCPERESCPWGQWKHTFYEIKAAKDAGRSGDCFHPISANEVCPLALRRALHSFSGATERWADRRAKGMTDADLAWAIGKEFGEWGQQSDGPGNTHMGKSKDPKIWFGSQMGEGGKIRKPDLQGKALVAAVREFLEIPLPQAEQAPAPWAGLPLMQMMEER